MQTKPRILSLNVLEGRKPEGGSGKPYPPSELLLTSTPSAGPTRSTRQSFVSHSPSGAKFMDRSRTVAGASWKCRSLVIFKMCVPHLSCRIGSALAACKSSPEALQSPRSHDLAARLALHSFQGHDRYFLSAFQSFPEVSESSPSHDVSALSAL